jgi:DNA-binding CsgD family transcriptional regulator
MTQSFDKVLPMETTDTPASASFDGAWVSAWRDTVAASPSAAGIIDFASTRFLELSPSAAELLCVTPEAGRGLDYLTVAEHPAEAAMTLHLASQGSLDGLEGRRRFEGADGSLVELRSYARVVRYQTGRQFGLWVVANSESEAEAAVLTGRPDAAPPLVTGDMASTCVTLGIVGDRWQVTRTEATGGAGLGSDVAEGTPIVELTHPNDAGVLLLTLAGATIASRATAYLRWRLSKGSWRAVVLGVTMSQDDDGPAFHLTAGRGLPGFSPESLDRAALPAVRDLPPRQREIISRLARGQRVRQIASELYLSESTVRNHLVAIFRKTGVHSQHELLTRLRQSDDGD